METKYTTENSEKTIPVFFAESFLTAVIAAKEAGDAILEIYGSDFEIKFKDNNSPLTLADEKSHAIIMANLQSSKKTAEFPVLSEEGRDIPFTERKNWEYFWLVDPLDGTKEFIKRNGEFTVNIALIKRNTPVMGVVYAPAKNLFYFALKGFGAFKLNNIETLNRLETDHFSGNALAILAMIADNSAKMPLYNPSTDSASSKLTIVGSRSHATSEIEEFIEKMNKEYNEVNFISAGSSLKFCLIAEGVADIYPRFGPTMEWDTAAGQCIAEQSNCKVFAVEDKHSIIYNKEDLKNGSFICERAPYSAEAH